MSRAIRPSIAAGHDADDPLAAQAVAVRLLHGAAQSATTVERKLLQRGFSPAATSSALNALRDRRYVDDDALAQSIVRRRLSGGFGRRRILADLRGRGLGPAAIDAAMADIDDHAERRAACIARDKIVGLLRSRSSKTPLSLRLAGAMERRGFASDVVADVVRALCAESGDGMDVGRAGA